MELHVTFMDGLTDVIPVTTRPTVAEAGALIRKRFLTPAFSFCYVWRGVQSSTTYYAAVDN